VTQAVEQSQSAEKEQHPLAKAAASIMMLVAVASIARTLTS